MHKTAVRSTIAVGMVFAAGIALAGCASASPSSSTAPTAAAGAVDLSGVCPATVTIQTDWNPEADHGHLYQLLGPNPVINADKKSVSGDLYASGKSTGVKVEIRSGGPAIGFSTVSSEMYKDKDITLGYVSTDEAVQLSASLPTTAVFAENDISPQMIMWDPATYPKVKTIKDLATALKDDGGVVRYFQGAAYMGYLQGSGILPEAQTDGAYDGTPAKFVTAKGKDGQQGFATAEPYIYQNEVSAWGKPVNFQLINDTGYPIYPEAMSVRSSELSTLSPCLKKLVPVLQQADVDYISKPAATNKLVTDLVTAFNNGWVYSEKVADFGVSQMKKLKIASNGSNAYVGDMDEARVQKVIDIDTPLFTASGSAPKTGLKAADLFTNEFLDTSIGF
ncbi:ABC transporter substrate-binding protein [Glaciihabitans sp. INWT7]|uniref:ABC transporter substrate-binding protein n=1 Tax=Glaciihabitans sp. INWT7 TaxID=2596912 RepID=UPI0016262CE6|nr:ABC transporter substrate-binding protein [Glaciihabitans sp. INWT7]QNE46087.1 ABC transporter substrate-binding protein [Glaciihabitans sp. INWT7]